MAIYHCSLKTISRSNGQSIVASAAYRHACAMTCEGTGEHFDYRRKKGVSFSKIFVPAGTSVPGWTQDRAILWNAAEKAEVRKNSRLGREIVIALPCELDEEARKSLTQAFSQWVSDRYCAVVDAAIHEPGAKGDERNWHAHLLMSARRIGAEGFGEKIRELDDRKRGPEEIDAVRSEWERLANEALERSQKAVRVDRRSLEAQGINRLPTAHLGPQATAMERAGISTRLGDLNREALSANSEIIRQESEASKLQDEEGKLVELAESSRLHSEMVIAERAVDAAREALREKEKELDQLHADQEEIETETNLHNQSVQDIGFFEQFNPFVRRKINTEAKDLEQKISKIQIAKDSLINVILELKNIYEQAKSKFEYARLLYMDSYLFKYSNKRKDAHNAIEEIYGDAICKLLCPNSYESGKRYKEYNEYIDKLIDSDHDNRMKIISVLHEAEKRYEVQEIFYKLSTYVSKDTSITGRERLRDKWLKEWDNASQYQKDEMVSIARKKIDMLKSYNIERKQGYSR